MIELTPPKHYVLGHLNCIPQSKAMHIMPRGHIETGPSTCSYFVTRCIETPKGRDSRPVVWSLIGLFPFRSNPVYKVYQHRSRNGGILEVAWSTGSLKKNSKRHCCCGVKQPIHFRNLLMEQARIEHAPNGSLLTYITTADAMVNNKEQWLQEEASFNKYHRGALHIKKTILQASNLVPSPRSTHLGSGNVYLITSRESYSCDCACSRKDSSTQTSDLFQLL